MEASISSPLQIIFGASKIAGADHPARAKACGAVILGKAPEGQHEGLLGFTEARGIWTAPS